MFFFIKKEIEQTTFDLYIDGILESKYTINTKDHMIDEDRSMIHKIGIFKMIKKMITNSLAEGNVYDDIYYAK